MAITDIIKREIDTIKRSEELFKSPEWADIFVNYWVCGGYKTVHVSEIDADSLNDEDLVRIYGYILLTRDNISRRRTDVFFKKNSDAYSDSDVIAFGNFIRDNYYVAGTPKMLSYHPSIYPHAKVEEIFTFWKKEQQQ